MDDRVFFAPGRCISSSSFLVNFILIFAIVCELFRIADVRKRSSIFLPPRGCCSPSTRKASRPIFFKHQVKDRHLFLGTDLLLLLPRSSSTSSTCRSSAYYFSFTDPLYPIAFIVLPSRSAASIVKIIYIDACPNAVQKWQDDNVKRR
ncbi:MAG: hypothetical protein MZU97_15565 [Bacillus subtilis]|nr:hypothetical protein [Bacillus subtilis]